MAPSRKENHVYDSLEIVRRRARSITLRDLCLGNCAQGLSQRRSGSFLPSGSPNGLVPFAVRECTDYADRQVPSAKIEGKSDGRLFGFATTLTVQQQGP